MPASYEPEGERTGRRRLTWLFWAGVGVAPLAALLLLLGQGVGALRAAAVLAVLSVVMIGLSVTLREDVSTVRDDFSETLRREVDLVRADVDTLRRGVELTMHRELERVRGELEAARQDTVFRAEATRLQAVEGRYERISGEVPSAEDFQTIEPIREEFVNNARANGRAQQPMMTEQIRVDTIRADAIRSEPVRVAAARVDDGAAAQAKVNSGTTYSSAARAESSGYERYESYDDAPASAPPAPAAPAGTGAELERLSSTTRWSAPAWDSGMDEPQATAEWQPPAWDDAAGNSGYGEPAYEQRSYAEPATTYSPSVAGTYSSTPSGAAATGYDTPSGSYGFGRNAAATTGSASAGSAATGTTYGSTNGYNSESYGSSDVIAGDVLSSDTSYDDYSSGGGWSSPTTYSLGSDALGSFGSESLVGGSFGSGNGFGAGNGFGTSTSFGNDSGLSGYRSGLPELPALPSSPSDSSSWSQPADKSPWETPSWDDSPSSYGNSWSSTPSTDAWAASDTYSTPPSQEYTQPPSDFELPSLDHLPTVNVRKSIGGYATTTSIGGYATTTSIGGYASGGTPSTGRHSGGGADRNGNGANGANGAAGDYNRGYDADLPAERRIFLDLPEQSYNWRG